MDKERSEAIAALSHLPVAAITGMHPTTDAFSFPASPAVDELLASMPTREGLRQFAFRELGICPQSTHEENVLLGDRITTLRDAIVTYTSGHDISLKTLAKHPEPVDEPFRDLLRQYHEVATRLAIGNWRLIPAQIAASFPVERLGEQNLDDLFQEGFLALLEAAKRYDPWHEDPEQQTPDTAIHFSSFAVPTIRGKMYNALPLFERFLTSVSSFKHLQEFRRAQQHLERRYESRVDFQIVVLFLRLERLLDREPTDEELGDYMNEIQQDARAQRGFARSCRRIQRIMTYANAVSLDDEVSHQFRDEHGEITLVEEPLGDTEQGGASIFGQPQQANPEDAVSGEFLLADIERAFAVLTEREQEFLCYRFGLRGQQAHTNREAARHFQMGRHQAISLESRVLRKLRHPTRSRELQDYNRD